VPRSTGSYKAGVPVQVQAINGGQIVSVVLHTTGFSITQYVETVQPGAQPAQVAFFPGSDISSQLQVAPGFRQL